MRSTPPHLHRDDPDIRPLRPLQAVEPEPRRSIVRTHPLAVGLVTVALLGFLAADALLLVRRERYLKEDARLRAGMTLLEREKADAALERDSSRIQRLRLELALLQRQAHLEPELHLAISADSGVMHLEQDGADLRDAPVELGPERRIGQGDDTVRMVVPRGTRLVERILGPDSTWEIPAWVYADRGLPTANERTLKGALGPVALLLSGGVVVYSMPVVGPLNDSAYVLPGSIRARPADLEAVRESVRPGMKVYLY